MPTVIDDVLVIALGYLMGSMPWGYWVPRLAKGIDIRAIGSGNIGAANVWRAAGLPIALVVVVLDVLKGLVPVLIALQVGGDGLGILTGVAAMLGHWRPLFLGLRRGGKVVATSGGVLLALAPLASLLAIVVWVVVFLLSRYSSLASLAAAVAMPVLVLVTGESRLVVTFTAAAALAVILLHRANIARLARGEENRFSFGRRSRPATGG
jgi:glycerol-3-phosphate acyltransferase PlsY